jgi:hypothetical protein
MQRAIKTGIIYGLAWVVCTSLGVVTLSWFKPVKIDARHARARIAYFDHNDKLVTKNLVNEIYYVKYPHEALKVHYICKNCVK